MEIHFTLLAHLVSQPEGMVCMYTKKSKEEGLHEMFFARGRQGVKSGLKCCSQYDSFSEISKFGKSKLFYE